MMNIYERIYTLLTEGILAEVGQAKADRMLWSHNPKTTSQGTLKTRQSVARRSLRGIKNGGKVADPTKTLGSGKPEMFQRAVKAGKRTLPKGRIGTNL